MEVNYQNQTISKPQGKRTAPALIKFDDLTRFIAIYQEVVDVKSPTTAMNAWVSSGYAEGKVEISTHVAVKRSN